MDYIKDFTVKNGDRSTVIITGEIPYSELESHRSAALKYLGKDIEMDGFRKGQVPENLLMKRLGSMSILTEMAERALSHAYAHALREHKIDAIGQPQIQITKIAEENPLGFTATTAVVPQFTLPDVEEIAKEKNENKETAIVTDEEVENQITEILKQKAAYEKMKRERDTKPEAADSTDLPTPETVATKEDEKGDGGEAEIPELTDELVASLGQPGQFKDVADFKAKIREHLEIEKKQQSAQKHRASITDAVLEATDMTLPQILIESELEQMFAQMTDDLARSNLKIDDYLAHIKKTKEELKQEWTPAAEKRAKLQLILNKVAKEKLIAPEKADVETQVEQILEQFKDAKEENVRLYVTTVLTNEAVMKYLEAL